jgi:hypothetical protein
MKGDISQKLNDSFSLDERSLNVIADSIKAKTDLTQGNSFSRFIKKYIDDRRSIQKVKTTLKSNKLPKSKRIEILDLVKNEISLNRRIERLQVMQNLFKYWHVAHLPFALVMLVIMVIHVAVTIVFGYKWIF